MPDSSFDKLSALYDAYVVAEAAEAWADAESIVRKAMLLVAHNPDLEKSAGSGGRQSIKWNGQLLPDLLRALERARAAAVASDDDTGPWQSTKITYVRPT